MTVVSLGAIAVGRALADPSIAISAITIQDARTLAAGTLCVFRNTITIARFRAICVIGTGFCGTSAALTIFSDIWAIGVD